MMANWAKAHCPPSEDAETQMPVMLTTSLLPTQGVDASLDQHAGLLQPHVHTRLQGEDEVPHAGTW